MKRNLGKKTFRTAADSDKNHRTNTFEPKESILRNIKGNVSFTVINFPYIFNIYIIYYMYIIYIYI